MPPIWGRLPPHAKNCIALLGRKGMGTMLISRRTMSGALALAALPAPSRAQPTGWQKLPAEPFRGKQDDIAFIDPDTGWYGNGTGKLFATTDGGRSWRQVWNQPGTFIRALGFIDARRGFLGNVGVGSYPGVTDRQPLYSTTDGGASWQPVVAPSIDAVAGICGIDVLPTRRGFQGDLVDTHVVHAAGRVGGPAAVLRSVDGGTTWSVQDLSKQAGMILDIKFRDAMTGFIAAASDSDTEKAQALILATSDGGRTWSPVYRGTRRFENVWKLSWPSARIGYATVQSYDPAPGNTARVILKTTNGGRSWRELPLVTAPGVQQFGIGFVDERRGWVGTRTGGFETRDGGASWAPVAFGPAVNKLRIVRAGGITRAFAIGSEVHRLDL